MRFLWHLAQAGFLGVMGASVWGWLVAVVFGRDELQEAEEDFWDRYEVGDEWLP